MDAKRLVIYFFYDTNGIIDDYIPYMLSDLKKNNSEIFFVSNGKIEEESKKKLLHLADTVFERENKGLDAWAYKESLEKIGFEKLKEYDEVILMNYTIMGPVFPFSETFSKMDARDIDFWGLTKFFKTDSDPFGTIDIGYIPEHLQSHFIAIRKSMLSSPEFEKYWANMPMMKDYKDSVGKHETKFTRYFAKLGFKWDCSSDMDDLEEYNPNCCIFAPVTLLKEKRCPVFKRRCFMHLYEDLINFSVGENAYELMQYLKNETDYDTDLIWQNILRCYDMQLIKDNLQLNYFLPKEEGKNAIEKANWQSKKIALIFHAYFPDLIESTVRYVNAMPETADVYITTDTDEKKEFFEKAFSDNKFRHFEVIKIRNRGRDVSALLVASKGFINDYDYVCFAHDKKVGQLSPKSIGAGFAYQCLENVLGSEGYVKNIIELFEENPRLGILMPPPPSHAQYFLTYSLTWGPNYVETKKLYDKLGLRVPMSEKYYPIAPLGTMFWFRPEGMKKLFDVDWEYEDFPEEPNKVDGTVLHAVERIYGVVEQDAGYYGAWGMIDYGAAMLFTSCNFMVGKFAQMAAMEGIAGTYNHVLDRVQNKGLFARLKRRLMGTKFSVVFRAYGYMRRKGGALLRKMGLRR